MPLDIALEEETLKELIRTLQEARKYGFSSPSSAIELYFEAAIDLNLRISLLLKEGVLGVKNNKHIKFLDYAQDVLGNPKQVSWRKPSRFYWDPIAEKMLHSYSSFLIHLKNQQNVFSFVRKLQFPDILRKDPAKTQVLDQKLQKKRMQLAKRSKNASYYRRLRNQKKT